MDLLGSERLWLRSPQKEHTDDLIATRQGGADERANLEDSGAEVVLRIGEHVDDRGGAPIEEHPTRQAPPVTRRPLVGPVPLKSLSVAEVADVRDELPAASLESCDGSVVRAAEPDRVGCDALENAVEIEYRSAHVFEDF